MGGGIGDNPMIESFMGDLNLSINEANELACAAARAARRVI